MARAPSKGSSAILTLPNAISFARILLIPVFTGLIIHRGTELAGLLVFGAVASTDWVDGVIARRTGSVTELGKILDPTADRLAVAAGLVAVLVRGAFPLWAALLILVRDAVVLIVGTALMLTRRVRVDVRFVGKSATFGLMLGVPLVAWGNLGFAFEHAALALGWTCYAVAIVEYYVAAALYAGDLR
ncbi:MAG TPA: CDP-alcohol phosphatidyltransferase family protein, partial [Actinomycetota bacterium]